jgi:hypothetical protein
MAEICWPRPTFQVEIQSLIANLTRRTPTAKYLGLTGITVIYLTSKPCPRTWEDIKEFWRLMLRTS